MPKIAFSLLLSTLFLSSCQPTIVENTTLPEGMTHYENRELGISFDYPEEWLEPILNDSPHTVKDYEFIESIDYSGYFYGDYGPSYDWTLQLGEDMSQGQMDPPDCEGDACPLFCGDGQLCFTASLSGFDLIDLDVLTSQLNTLSDSELMDYKLLTDEMMGDNRVIMIPHQTLGGSLYVYISNGEKTVLLTVPFASDKSNDGIEQIAASMKFN